MVRTLSGSLLLAFTFVAGCVSAPARPPADSALALSTRPPSAHELAEAVNIEGHRGRLTRGERTALLARLAAQGNSDALQRHLSAQSIYGEIDLSAHNQARLLIDGPDTFQAMFEAIDGAASTVMLESYIVDDQQVAQRLAELLEKKRVAGVEVFMIYDDIGSLDTQAAYFDRLRAAGVAVCAFNPVNPLKRPGYWAISHRDHRKIVVVDRKVAFTGGINISSVYSLGSLSRTLMSAGAERGWRDTQIELRGQAAETLDDLVRDTWRSQGCQGRLPPPAQALESYPPGREVVQLIPSSPDDGFNRIYAMLLTAIDTAQHSVYLTMAYFAPGEEMIEALSDAARRGVDVQLVLPSVSDFKPVMYAGQSYYGRLLEARVRIHELQGAILHAKTAVIDGVVSTVGSSNLDWRSLTGNNEVNAVVYGEDFAASMQGMFARDVAASHEIHLEEWRRRGPWRRFLEAAARAFEFFW